MASDACNGGKIKIEGDAVKPSRLIGSGEIINVNKDGLHRVFKVKDILSKRVGAALVKDFMEDLTPEDELIKQKMGLESAFYRPKGLGRPTKKERRQLGKLLD